MEKTKSTNENNKTTNFTNMSIKEVIAAPVVQSAIKTYLGEPKEVVIKKVRKSYKPKDADEKTPATQKVEAICGTSLMDAEAIEMTLVGIELDKDSINHMYRIEEYTYGLNANMVDGKFGGYAASGFKLLVTQIEEIEAKNENTVSKN